MKEEASLSTRWQSLPVWLKFFSVLMVLILVRCSYKEIKFYGQRQYAIQACEEKGGYWTKGPVTVPGYMHGYSGFVGYARPLLEEGYEFIESQGMAFSGVYRTTNNPREAYSRVTIEKRPSPLCERYEKYLPRMPESRKNELKAMGLKDDQCIGVETFLDPALLKSDYQFRVLSEIDSNVPAITWGKVQIINIHTGELISKLTAFGGCLDGRLQIEPFYNGCWGGIKNSVHCPTNPDDWNSDKIERLLEEGFVPLVKQDQ